MKTPDSRFYCPLISVGTIVLDENESSHAVRVCRAANGDTLQLCDGLGHYADATITKADAKACEVHVDTVEEAPLKRPRLNLGIACLKDDALEEVVFHAAQTETDSVIFLRTDYSQEPKNSDLHKLVRRSELKALVSLKQSKKPWMTRIEGPIEFDKWLKDYQGDLILCDIDGERKLDLGLEKKQRRGKRRHSRYFTCRSGRWIFTTRNRSDKSVQERESPFAELRQHAPPRKNRRNNCVRESFIGL